MTIETRAFVEPPIAEEEPLSEGAGIVRIAIHHENVIDRDRRLSLGAQQNKRSESEDRSENKNGCCHRIASKATFLVRVYRGLLSPLAVHIESIRLSSLSGTAAPPPWFDPA